MEGIIERVIAAVLRDADEREISAAHGGHHHDGGASRLREQVAFYRYGRSGVMPPSWEEYASQAEREADPEWSEFQRLAKKFGASS